MDTLPDTMRFGSRQSVTRVEDLRFITGRGRYVDDQAAAGELWLAVFRSPHAHARIASLDVSAAAAMPGVVAIYTGADLVADNVGAIPTPLMFKRPGGEAMTVPPRRLLAHEVVRFVGEGVAAVVAKTRDEAQAACEAIEAEFEALPAIADPVAASAPDAPKVWPEAGGNVVAVMSYGDAAAVEAVFAKAEHVVTLDVVSQRLVPAAMEPRSTMAEVDPKSDRLTLHVQSQTPATTRDVLSEAILKRPKDSVRVLVRDIGGGFGQKTGVYPEDGLVAYAATKLKRKVRWRGDRTDEFLGGTHGRDLTSTAELALDARGRIQAFRVKSLGNTGAYLTSAGALIPLVLGPFVATGTYDIPLLHLDIKAVMTNTAPLGAYRGAGRPEAVYIIERLMDAASRQLGMDPCKLRKVNFIKPAQMPYTNATGQVYDSGMFAHMLDHAVEKADWNGFAARKRAAKAKGLLYGRGVASYIEWTGARVHKEKVSLHATANGRIVLHSATQAMGQGLETSYAQIVSQALGVPMDVIDVIQGDTDLVQGVGSVGSRSLFIGGTAVAVATVDLVRKATEKASELLETSVADIEYDAGWLSVAGTDRKIGLFDIAGREQNATLKVDSQGEVDAPSWPNGAHICEVEIDPQTGRTTVARYTTVDDVGIPMNPMLVFGQIHGGVAQGIGQALFEAGVYSEDGQLLTASFQDYGMPRADDLPSIDTTLDDAAPCRTNPLGAKGCGESGAIGAPPCVVNGVMDALASVGVSNLHAPLTPAKIWQAIRDAQAAAAA